MIITVPPPRLIVFVIESQKKRAKRVCIITGEKKQRTEK